jgi:hypothetical protein
MKTVKLIPFNKYQTGVSIYQDGFLESYAILPPKEADQIKASIEAQQKEEK